MKHGSKRFLSILLGLALMLGLFPGMSLTAYADDPYASLKNTTTVITFDGKPWYLIDYDASTVTLLAKNCVGASKFGSKSTYSGSTVETFVNNWYKNNISDDAKTAVNGTFLLTTAQANAINNANVLKCSQASGATVNYWWLCSPGLTGNLATCVNGRSGFVYVNGYDVSKSLGVRPALKLNLSSVICHLLICIKYIFAEVVPHPQLHLLRQRRDHHGDMLCGGLRSG